MRTKGVPRGRCPLDPRIPLGVAAPYTPRISHQGGRGGGGGGSGYGRLGDDGGDAVLDLREGHCGLWWSHVIFVCVGFFFFVSQATSLGVKVIKLKAKLK